MSRLSIKIKDSGNDTDVSSKILSPAAKVFSPPSTPRSPEEVASSSLLYDMNSNEAEPVFRRALDSIYGLPYGGSLAFIRNGLTNESVTEVRSYGEGGVHIPAQVILPGKLSVWVESTGLGSVDEDPQARLLVNGKDFAPNHTGFNFLVIHPETLDAYVAVFNTSQQIGNESKHMAQFVYSISPQAIVLMAVKGDGVRRLHPMARTALQYLGVELPPCDNSVVLAECVGEIPPDDDNAADLLNVCAIVNAPNCAQVLAEAGWNVNHQKNHGTQNTALLDAVFYGSFNVIRVLIQQCEANAELRNKYNETAAGICEKLFGVTLEDVVADVAKDSQIPESPQENS